ncbi:MAG: dipeptidase [Bacteroidales bacterium]|jgi:membrane dipeptidase|nr:dipeptidase [Bacteroidales bacterium]
MYKHIFKALLIFTLLYSYSCNNDDFVNRANKIHNKILTIDTHADTPLNFLDENFDISKWNDNKETHTCVDFPRMKTGGLDAIFFAVFIGQGERNDEGNNKAKNRALKIFHEIHTALEKKYDIAEIATSPNDAYRIKDEDKLAIFIGLENGYPIGKDLSNIDEFYDLGARYITLCHTKNNDICDSSTDEPEHNGLSKFGETVVQKMNKKGMLIDVSHISDSSFYDVVKLSETPIFASHSCTRSICDNPRNLNDDMLLKLKENGGVIQICFLSEYVKTPLASPKRDSAFSALSKKFHGYNNLSDSVRKVAHKEWNALRDKFPRQLAEVKDLVDHIDHVVNTIGIDYVGIGTDFDGGGGLKDCRDVSEMKNVTIELLKRGYSEKDIEKIWSGNFIRVFRKVREHVEL